MSLATTPSTNTRVDEYFSGLMEVFKSLLGKAARWVLRNPFVKVKYLVIL